MAEELEDYIKIYDKWRDDGMKAVGIADWAHAAKCFKECAFYAAIIDWIKRRAKQ